MSVAQTRAAARKIKLRYKSPKFRSVGASIELEKKKAARAANIKK